MSVLEYASPQPTPPRWREALHHLRFVLLAAYAVLLAAAVWFWCWAGGEVLGLAICLIVLFAFQAAFLVGMPQLRWPRPTRRRAMWISIVTAGALAGLLSFGLLATALNAFNVWDNVTKAIEGHIFWGLLIAWIVWTIVFGVMCAGEWLRGFQRMYKILIAGTWLELLVTIPVDVQVRKRTSCYCGEGTFFALIIGTTVAIWSFGPGIVLLFLTRRLQRDGYFSLCRKCGNDLSAIQSDRCPACNAKIPPRQRASRAVERV